MDDEDIRDIFSGLGKVTIRRLFGGKGIYHEGLIVGIVMRGELMFKGDAASGPEFEAAGGTRWTYESRHRKTVAMPYWRVPPAAFDDPDEMAVWTRKAYEAALRAET